MNQESVRSSFLLGDTTESLLFKIAIHFAEFGLRVWFICPKSFEKLPENISRPNKDILQLITFIYLQDYKDLLKHLNGIHLWHKTPNIIILWRFEVYSKIDAEKYNSSTAALILTCLLDSASVCVKKGQKDCYIIVAGTRPCDKYMKRIKVLHDIYFSNIFVTTETHEEEVLKSIINYYNVK